MGECSHVPEVKFTVDWNFKAAWIFLIHMLVSRRRKRVFFCHTDVGCKSCIIYSETSEKSSVLKHIRELLKQSKMEFSISLKQSKIEFNNKTFALWLLAVNASLISSDISLQLLYFIDKNFAEIEEVKQCKKWSHNEEKHNIGKRSLSKQRNFVQLSEDKYFLLFWNICFILLLTFSFFRPARSMRKYWKGQVVR